MSQYDLADSTSEVMCSQPVTEIACSINSTSQQTSWTRKYIYTESKGSVLKPMIPHTCIPFCSSLYSYIISFTINVPSLHV